MNTKIKTLSGFLKAFRLAIRHAKPELEDGQLRIRGACPITFVAAVKGSEVFTNDRWEKAGNFLGMPIQLQLDIVRAADDEWLLPNKEINDRATEARRRLLQACGLKA
jgi:hypothetical protein